MEGRRRRGCGGRRFWCWRCQTIQANIHVIVSHRTSRNRSVSFMYTSNEESIQIYLKGSTPAASASDPSIPLILSYWLFKSLTASLAPSFSSNCTIPARSCFKLRAICGRCSELVGPGESVCSRWRSRSSESVWVDWEVSLARVAIGVGMLPGWDERERREGEGKVRTDGWRKVRA